MHGREPCECLRSIRFIDLLEWSEPASGSDVGISPHRVSSSVHGGVGLLGAMSHLVCNTVQCLECLQRRGRGVRERRSLFCRGQ